MGEFFSAYGLFLVELLTIVALVAAVVLVAASAKRSTPPEGISVKYLNEDFRERANALRRVVLGRRAFRKEQRRQKKESKRDERSKSREADGAEAAKRPRLFVVDFRGDIRATATASLREEVSAILAVAGESDRVLVRLENAGGAVHEHGLAASQLARIKEHGIELVAAVDKVAASGGYLMACVADRILAAPFAIIGSIGVLAQLPNFHRWLDERGVDFEQITSGKFKRTLTLFGENTEEGREKVREELEHVHALFKAQIAEHRPAVDIEAISTGEHWYGVRARELALVDEVGTSDDFLAAAAEDTDIYLVRYRRRKSFVEKLLTGAEAMLHRR